MENPEPIDDALAQQSTGNPRSLLKTEDLAPRNSTAQRISELRPKLFYEGWGITENPFGVTPDPRYFYQSKTHAEASSSLIIGIECGVGFQALIAPPGMGKTTILFDILEQFKDVARTAFLCQSQGNSSDLLRSLIAELGGEAHESDLVHMKQVINDLLVREKRAGRLTVVIIDEAQSLATSALETVRLLSNFETSTEKLLHIILAGQPQLAQRLASPDVAQLSQRISVLTTLIPFDLEDTEKYVDHRLKIAGYRRQRLFTLAALNVIWENSRGIPREINKLCFNAMLLARAAGQSKVDSDILREVVGDFDLERLRYEIEATSAGLKGVQPTDGMRAETKGDKLAADIDSSGPTPHTGTEIVVAGDVEPPASDCNNRAETQSSPALAAVDLATAEAQTIQIEAASRRVANAETAAESPDVQQPTSEVLIERFIKATVAAESMWVEVQPGSTKPEPAREINPDPLIGLDRNSIPAYDSGIKHSEWDSAASANAVQRARSSPGSLADPKLDLAKHSVPHLGSDSDSEVLTAGHADKHSAMANPIATSESIIAGKNLDQVLELFHLLHESNHECEATVASASAAADRLRIVPAEASLFAEQPTRRHWTRDWQLPIWMRSQWQSHKSSIYVGGAAVILFFVFLWQPTSIGPRGQPQTSIFRQLLMTLGLSEPSQRPVPQSNPEAQVWIDIRTGLYYCRSGEMYGKTPGGRFTTQRDAQKSQFKPANHEICL